MPPDAPSVKQLLLHESSEASRKHNNTFRDFHFHAFRAIGCGSWSDGALDERDYVDSLAT